MPTDPAASSSSRVPATSTPPAPVPSNSTPSVRPRCTSTSAPSMRAFSSAPGWAPEIDPDDPVDGIVALEPGGHTAAQCAVDAGEYDGLHAPTMPSCTGSFHPHLTPASRDRRPHHERRATRSGGSPSSATWPRCCNSRATRAWAGAGQMAMAVATGGETEPNVDPLARIQLEELARVAELQIDRVSGLTSSVGGRAVKIEPVTRTQWVQRSLPAYREPAREGRRLHRRPAAGRRGRRRPHRPARRAHGDDGTD